MEKTFKNALRYLMLLVCVLTLSTAFTSCGEDDDDDDDPENTSSIIGKWGIEGNIDGDYVTMTIEFKKNGKAVISEKYRDDPSDNYTITVDYTLSGDVTSGATLTMTGKTVDGDSYAQTYFATVSGSTLTLLGVGGEADGERLVLNRK